MKKVFVCFDELCFEPSLKYRTDALIFFIKVHSKCGVEPVNKTINGFVTFLIEKQVDMIWHETICQESNIVFFEIFLEAF